MQTNCASSEAININRTFYNQLWSGAEFCEPELFNTWPLLSDIAKDSNACLEIGPGLRPKLPVEGTHFIDLSEVAVSELNKRGGKAVTADATSLPYENQHFDLICAFDVIEHMEDDQAVLTEISRVLKPGGSFLFSVPLHRNAWSSFDNIVGHCRRYDYQDVTNLVEENGLVLHASAGFGMKPKSRFWTQVGMWWLEKYPEKAFHYYNKYLFPLGLKRQEVLHLKENPHGHEDAEGAIFHCTKTK